MNGDTDRGMIAPAAMGAAAVALAISMVAGSYDWSALSAWSLAVMVLITREADAGPARAMGAAVAPPLALFSAGALAGTSGSTYGLLLSLAAVELAFFLSLASLMLSISATTFRAGPASLLLLSFALSCTYGCLSTLLRFFSSALSGQGAMVDNAALMWPLVLHLVGGLAIATALYRSPTALRLIRSQRVDA